MCFALWSLLLLFLSLNDRDALKLLDQKQKGKPIEAKPVAPSPPLGQTRVPLAPASSIPLPASRPHGPPVSIPGRPASVVKTD